MRSRFSSRDDVPLGSCAADVTIPANVECVPHSIAKGIIDVKFHLLLLPLLAIGSPSLAQSAQSTEGLEEAAKAEGDIVVTANRSAQPVSRVGQSVSVLDAKTITQRQAVVVSELLSQTPGVTVVRNGGVGTVTGVSIRGAGSDQTVALIDGVKINDPSSPAGGFDFGALLIGSIARIEVLRGAQSVLWGNQAIGGVVNVITRQPTDEMRVNARAEGGWHQTGQVFANISDKIGPVSASLGGGYYRTDGISAFDGGSEHDGHRNYAANGSLGIAVANGVSVDLRGFYVKSRTDFDSFVFVPPDGFALGDTPDYTDSTQWIGYSGLNIALFDGRLHNRFSYAHTDTDRSNLNPDSTPRETFRGIGRNDRLEYQGTLNLTSALFGTFGVEREVSRFTTSDPFSATTRGRARLFSVYGQVALTPIKGLTGTAGVRHDDHNIFGGATTFSGSAVYSPNDGATTLRASYSEGFKAPTVYQLQSEYGNRLLRPERSAGFDAGLTQRAAGGAIEASATYFHRRSSDLITFVSCAEPLSRICVGRPFGTYDNVARAVSQGLEFALTIKPDEALTLTGSYTYLNAEDRSAGGLNNGRRLAGRPSQSVTLNADYRFAFGLATGATLTAIGDSFDDAGNTRRLEGYVLAALRASFPLTRYLQVYGRVDNVLDQRYETIFRYGQPGRAAFGGIRLTY